MGGRVRASFAAGIVLEGQRRQREKNPDRTGKLLYRWGDRTFSDWTEGESSHLLDVNTALDFTVTAMGLSGTYRHWAYLRLCVSGCGFD
jgi:hypothetical protein